MIAIARPSGSHQWTVCTGSHKMQQDIISSSSSAAADAGTLAHEVATQLFNFYLVEGEFLSDSDLIKIEGVTAEMIDSARLYVHDVIDYCNTHGLIKSLHVEEKLNLDCIYPGMSGTPDSWVFNETDNTLVVWDLKYGFGLVDEYENPQLIIYAAGIISLLKLINVKVKLKIVQPRAYHPDGSIREWTL